MNPLDQAIYKSRDVQNKLASHMKKSLRHIDIFQKYLDNIKHANEQYAQSLLQSSERFYQEMISKEVIENEALLCCYDYLFHFISLISQHHKKVANEVQTKLVEPFALFSENFKMTNKNLLKSSQHILGGLETAKSESLKKQQKYYFKSQEAENHLLNKSGALSKVDLDKSQDVTFFSYEKLNKQAGVEKACDEYKKTLEAVNKKWENHGSEFYTIFENYDLNEETRFKFIKFNVSQLIKMYHGLYTTVTSVVNGMNSDSFENKVRQIEESIGKGKFGLAKSVEGHLGKAKTIPKEEFVSFNDWKRLYGKNANLSNQKIFKEIEDSEASDEIKFLDTLVSSILSNSDKDFSALGLSQTINSSRKQYESILGYLNPNEETEERPSLPNIEEKDLNKIFAVGKLRRHFLEKITTQAKLSKDHPINKWKWGLLKTVTNYLISNLTSEELADYEHIHLFLSFLTKFYKEDLNLRDRKYLGACMKGKISWEKVLNWEDLANYLLQRRRLEEGQRVANQNNPPPRRHTEVLTESAITKSNTKVLSKPTTNDKKLEIDENSIKMTVVDEINVYLLHLELDQSLCLKILLHVARKLRVDQESYRALSNILEKKRDIELSRQMQNMRNQRIRKFNKHGKMFAVTLALEYLDFNDKPFNLLRVNKEWNRTLERKVYRLVLRTADEKLKMPTRLKIWKILIKLDKSDITYKEVKNRYESELNTSLPIDEIIKLDVHRSFNDHPYIDKPVLTNLLKLYARYDRRISYCQGMNYVMGFLLSVFQNEEITFMFFVKMVNKYLGDLVQNDLKSLQLLFYQLDRLIAIFLPDLSNHFKKEKVEANLFSPSWFITLFTTVCQVSYKSYLLMKIWDAFLLEGWKGFLKSCVYLLMLHKNQFMKDRFDQIITFFNDITSTELFTNYKYGQHLDFMQKHPEVEHIITDEEKAIKNFTQEINKIRITDKLLKQLEEEYKTKL